MEVFQHVTAGRPFAAPPRGQRRQLELFAQPRAAQRRQKARHRRRFEHPGAQRIGHHDIARPHGGQQTWHTQYGVAAKRQRIAVAVILTAQNDIHRHQTAQRLQKHALVAHHQVGPFH